MSEGLHIAVVGAGIVGSAIALELATRGAVVTLVDAGGERASENSFGWINASWFNPPDYFRLRHSSMGVWRRWATRVPGLDPHWSGCLVWDLDDAALDAFVRDHGAMGYAIRMVDRDTIRRIEPGLADPPARAALAEDEGFIEAGAAASALRTEAEASGVRLVEARVEAVERTGLRLSGGGRLSADRIIVAAGQGTAALLDLPVAPLPGLMVLTAPARTRVAHVLAPPDLNLRQDAQGRILCGGEAGGSAIDREPGAIADDLVERARALFGEPGLALERVIIGHRPMPADEHPVIGPVPGHDGIYAAVMHSGVTLAPGVAELIADEVLDSAEAPLLAPFRPNRFSG
ncbi:MAG TPA: FAD-dependent oxidoreductase [Thermohalobaculum sp.]|nr:FAD-dependent oxidoreductase [Thermohalobaculum sp.]